MKVWILTEEYNDYDQHGEYFVAAYKDKPTREQVAAVTGYFSDHYIDKVLNGDGGVGCDYHWYWLREEECK